MTTRGLEGGGAGGGLLVRETAEEVCGGCGEWS